MNKVSNLNIFSKRMTLSEMVSMTAGEDCGRTDGDYLSWETAQWVLKGKASFSEVTAHGSPDGNGATHSANPCHEAADAESATAFAVLVNLRKCAQSSATSSIESHETRVSSPPGP